MLNHRLRDLLFHYKKGDILLQFYLVRVFKKIYLICSSGRVRTMETSQKASQRYLFDWINKMMSDMR